MSLVGTRPPTVDEWEQYELHHRSRMSTKPGITGMWQVSGRSDITDFEEVVRLDMDAAAGCRHTVIAETELKLIEVQLGEDINVHDKQKFELEY